MKTSNFLSLDWRDAGKALLTGIIAFLLNFLQETVVPNLEIPNEVKLLILACLGSLVRRFFTPAKEVNKIIGTRPDDRK